MWEVPAYQYQSPHPHVKISVDFPIWPHPPEPVQSAPSQSRYRSVTAPMPIHNHSANRCDPAEPLPTRSIRLFQPLPHLANRWRISAPNLVQNSKFFLKVKRNRSAEPRSRWTAGRVSAKSEPDAGQTGQSNRNAKNEEQVAGGLFRQGAGKRDAALPQRGCQRAVPLAEKVRQGSMKHRNGQPQQQVGKF